MNEKEVRQIVKDEFLQNYRSGSPDIPPHRHDGSDNLQINQTDVIPLTTVNGTIDMASVATYSFNMSGLSGAPNSLMFIGGAKHSAATAQHAMIIGNAQFGVNQQFQPESTKSVIMTGSKITKIIQGSGFMYINNTDLTKNVVGNSQGHIVYLFDNTGTDLIVANVISYSNSQIQIQVTTLASGWTISGLWIVT